MFRAAIAGGRLPAGYAADDEGALAFAGETLHACVASGPAARILRLEADGRGGVAVQEMPTEVLDRPAEPDSFGVSELRALRAGRHRWD